MDIINQIHFLRQLAKENDWQFEEYYSGRGMFGETCIGIIGPNFQEIIEKAAQLGFIGSNQDQMGRDYIVYWPKLKTHYLP